MFEDAELKRACAVIDNLVDIHPPQEAGFEAVDFAQKLNRLSELIDALRYHIGYPEPKDGRSLFQPTAVRVSTDRGRVTFCEGRGAEALDFHAANRLALPLLDYLYTYPPQGRRILALIREFVRFWLPACRMIDFERTATGVVRIETNVKFAALLLREAGLLSNSPEVAFRTWRLSAMGIMLANEIMAPTKRESHDPHEPAWWRNVFARVSAEELPARLERLKSIARDVLSNTKRRHGFLKQAEAAARSYRDCLTKNPKMGVTGHIPPEFAEVLRRFSARATAEDVARSFSQQTDLQRRLF